MAKEVVIRIPPRTKIITTHLSPEFIAAMPANYQSILHDWASAKFYLRKEAGLWKFDIDRSMHVVVRLRLQNQAPDPTAIRKIMMDNARSYDQITAAIGAGQFDTIDEVADALRAAATKVGQSYGIMSMQTHVVPAVRAD